MKQRLSQYGEVFILAMAIGVGVSGGRHLFGDDQVTLQTKTTNTWLTSKGYTAMDIMNEMATEEFAKSKGTIANYYKKHDKCTLAQYPKDCANDHNCSIALAHHNVEMVYRRIQMARELDMITDDMVHASAITLKCCCGARPS